MGSVWSPWLRFSSQLTTPYDTFGSQARSLTKGGDVREFVDPKLNGEYLAEAFDLILKLALSCTGIKQQRPSIEQVVSKLEEGLDISKQVKPLTSCPTLQFCIQMCFEFFSSSSSLVFDIKFQGIETYSG
jgi:hypothetical protein